MAFWEFYDVFYNSDVSQALDSVCVIDSEFTGLFQRASDNSLTRAPDVNRPSSQTRRSSADQLLTLNFRSYQHPLVDFCPSNILPLSTSVCVCVCVCLFFLF